MSLYQHSKYAAGPADIFKHACLIQALSRLSVGFSYLETHSGSGLYSLGEDLLASWHKGLKAVFSDLDEFPLFDNFRDVVMGMGYPELKVYPGSPLFSAKFAASATLCEIDRSVAAELGGVVDRYYQQATVKGDDGFEALGNIGNLDETAVFIDPPYKDIDDYRRCIAAFSQLRSACAVMVWYPLIDSAASSQLKTEFLNCFPMGCAVEIQNLPVAVGSLTGCGMLCSDAVLASDWQAVADTLSGLFDKTR